MSHVTLAVSRIGVLRTLGSEGGPSNGAGSRAKDSLVCVYARLLSSGTSYLDCGRPCEKHAVALRDQKGEEHPVIVDVGCRNTVFSAGANSVADDIPRLVGMGVRRFRVELLRETAKEAEALVRGYREVAEGKRSGAEVRARVGAVRRLGVLRVE